MRNNFIQNDAALRLVNLAFRMFHVAFNFQLLQNIEFVGEALLFELDNRIARFVQIAPGDIQIFLMRLFDERFVFLLLIFRFGFAAFLVLCRAHEPFDVADIVGVLPPIADLMLFTQLRGERDDFAHGIIQQVDIRRVMHIGFNHKGVAPPTQCFVFFFF